MGTGTSLLMVHGLLAVLSVATLALQTGLPPCQEPTSENQQNLRVLVEQLGSDRFAEREAAARSLRKLGDVALPALREASTRTKDLETRRAAQSLIEQILSDSSRTWQGTVFQGPASDIAAISLSRDHKLVISHTSIETTAGVQGHRSGVLRLWELKTGKELWQGQAHSGVVKRVGFAPNGEVVASAGFDRTDADVCLWNVKSGLALGRFSGHTAPVYNLEFSQDSQLLLTGSSDRTMRLLKVPQLTETRQFSNNTIVWSGVLSPDGKTLVHSPSDVAGGIVRDVETGVAKARLDYEGGSFCLGFLPDARSVITADGAPIRKDGSRSAHYRIRVWDAGNWKQQQELEGHPYPIGCLCVSADGTYVLSCGSNREARLWRLRDGRELRRHLSDSLLILSASFSPDGRSVALGRSDNSVLVLPVP